jgi:hypothetical protein
VRGRILVGVGAWLAGAVVATGFSHMAVSLLGRGIASDSGQLLSSQAAKKALDEIRATPSSAQSGVWPPAAPASAGPTSPAPASPAPTPAVGAQDRGALLTSQGGTIFARCEAAGVYLTSWSPAQGFLADNVARGPAAAAHVTFESLVRSITMHVSCVAGVARMNLTYQPVGWSDDDSSEPGDS